MNATTVPAIAPSRRDQRDARADRWFRYALVGTVAFVLLALASAALSMLWGGRDALQSQGLSFFLSAEWNPVENRYGALAPIYGTVVTAIIAMLLAVPLRSGTPRCRSSPAPPAAWR